MRVALLALLFAPVVAAAKKPNVLFIAVDDLRPQLGCFGKGFMRTPHIDTLAASGTLFRRSYCMVPTCGASRASLMTGIRPAANRFVNYLARASKDAPGVVTMNTHFKNHGYTTVSLGKIFHHPDDNAHGWSEKPWRPKGQEYQLKSNRALQARRSKKAGKVRRGLPYEAADVPEGDYRDAKLAAKAVETMRLLGQADAPFFLAVGFFKPHLPFVAPKKYWDMYDPKSIRLPETYHKPKNVPAEALHPSGELRAYAEVPRKGPVSDEMARKLIHGYYACVSFTDANVGKLLDGLDRLGLTKDTIVVLWGDHGWNLGEHTLWCKHCCFETSMHAPLIVRDPRTGGTKPTDGLTEFIDIYPSLCDLAGLPKPRHLQGQSFVPLMRDPSQSWKKAAVGRYRFGDTIRTDGYRYSEYTRGKAVTARMLYDHKADPGEDNNVAGDRTAVARELSRELNRIKGKPNPPRKKAGRGKKNQR